MIANSKLTIMDMLHNYQDRDDGTLLIAIKWIVDNVDALSVDECQRVYDDFCVMTWDRRFFDMPHNLYNPGWYADYEKWRLMHAVLIRTPNK